MDGSVLVLIVVAAMGYIIWCGHRNAKREAREKMEAEKAEAEARLNEKKDDSVA